MENSSQKIIDTLNELVQINHDRNEGYKVAANETVDNQLKELFLKYAIQSSQFAEVLAQEIHSLDGKPVEGTRLDGKIYRIWMDVKAAIAGNDRQAILNSCEYGEDVALRTYDDALTADVILPVNIRQLISKQKRELQEAHLYVKSLRDSMSTSERPIF
ncbi:MAG: PA2169 family four-helix-bundle protein [Chitinophagaceae bacterium]|nr:PA2169 family four-helix-bundle protein [Chitinophagaceae bacterium]